MIPTRLVVMAVIAWLLPASAAPQQTGEEPRTIMQRATADFLAGRLAESVAGFDRVAAMVPAAAPDLWQRGIALYYVGRYADCRRQFESHRTVNPADVENAAWHFLCVAAAESPDRAKAALLPVGPDSRRPMREVYEMFRGALPPDAVIAAAGDDVSGQFYAQLYVGLYQEAIGNTPRALEHLGAAAAERFARAGGYMHTVAKVHLQVRGAR
jgi:lipoprotein NlpI